MSGPTDPRQWSEARRWLVRADEDLRAAEALSALDPPSLETAAFHCQQAAEKMAKAVLIAHRQPPPHLHDVEELGRRIRALHPVVGDAFAALGGLTRWYVSGRYPDAGLEDVPTAAEVGAVLKSLGELRRQIESLAPSAP